MRKISGMLLALAASLALAATTVAAKDAAKDDVGVGGGGGGEKMQNEGKGGKCDRARHACAHRWGSSGPRFRRCLWHHGC